MQWLIAGQCWPGYFLGAPHTRSSTTQQPPFTGLPYSHLQGMIIHMKAKTTLILPVPLMRELKRRAAERGETLSAVVAETLQRGLSSPPQEARLKPLPKHRMGAPRVDLADRDQLYRAMDED
jgi:hypothetical protein